MATGRHPTSLFLRKFDLTRSPGFVEPGFGRAIKAQEAEPALLGNRLNPVRFLSLGRLGAEVEVNRPVVVRDHLVAFVVLVRVRLIGLQHGAGLRIVDHHRHELFGGRIPWQVQLVGLASVQIVALAVQIPPGVLRSLADKFPYHGRRVEGRHVEVLCPRINIAPTQSLVFEYS